MSKNVSIRGARLQFRERFESAIREFGTIAVLCETAKNPILAEAAETAPTSFTDLFQRLPAEIIKQILSFNHGATPSTAELIGMCWNPLSTPGDTSDKRFRIAVRKRPIWPQETKSGEFDSLSINMDRSQCVLHDTRLDRDHKTFTDHREFAMDSHFSESASNSEVFEREVRPLLNRVLEGERATFIAFGQTGTGKTHTVHGVEEELAKAIFNPGDGSIFEKIEAVEVITFEMRGKEISDLLNNRNGIKLLQAGDGQMHASGAKKLLARSSKELLAAFNAAHKLRSTSATTKNAQSSRSHAICRLEFMQASTAIRSSFDPKGKSSLKKNGGVLTLVDLAGSERNEDTSKHSKEEAREAAEINTSLMTLKECFRAVTEKVVEQETVIERRTSDGKVVYLPYKPTTTENENSENDSSAVERIIVRAKKGGKEKEMRMPFRNHQLTNFLKDCFMNNNHRTVVIAAASPLSSDVEHTRRTLELVCSMRGAPESMLRITRATASSTGREIKTTQPVVKWDKFRVAKWVKNFNEHRVNCSSNPPETSKASSFGKDNTSSMPSSQCDDKANGLSKSILRLPPDTDGKMLMRFPVARLTAFCGGDKLLANQVFKVIREENKMTSQVAFDRRKSMINLIRGEERPQKANVSDIESKVKGSGTTAVSGN